MASIKRNFLYNFLLSCSQVLLPLLSIPYVSRVLDPAGIGKVNFIDSFTYYFVIMAEFGITVYGIREVAREKNDPGRLSKLVSELIALHIVSSLCTFVLYAIGVIVLWDKIGDTRLLFFSLSFFIVNFFSCDWYFMGMEKFRFIALRTIFVRLLGLASMFVLIKQPDDYYIYYGIMILSAVAGIIWNNAIMLGQIHFSFRGINWKRHLRYVWVTYLINLFYSIPLMLDSVLLRLVNTASAVGLYAFSVKIVRTGITLLTDSFLVFFPRIVSLATEKDERQLGEKLLWNIRFIILFSIPMGAGFYLLADELTMVVLGDKFLPLANNLRLLSVFPFLKGVSLFLSNPVMIAHHHERNFLRNLVGGAIIFAGLALWLGFYYADTGVCAALVIAEVFILAANFISVKKVLPALVVFDFRAFLHAVIGSALFIPVIYLVKLSMDKDWQQLTAGIAGCLLVYGIFLLAVRNNFALAVKGMIMTLLIKK